MSVTRYKPEQIVTMLRQIEVSIGNGKTTPQACKEAEIAVQTFYRWRKEYGGLKMDQISTIIFLKIGIYTMAKNAPQRANVLQGTLDMFILRTLLCGSVHGHEIGKYLQRTTNDFLQMQHGSLYPALHRLERRRWVVSKWETAPDRNREFKYYRLTEKGRKQLTFEESRWKRMAEAVLRVMWPAVGES